MTDTIRAAILGASGYTGAELVRLLARHPRFRIGSLTGDRKAGQEMADVFPHLGLPGLPKLCTIEELDWRTIEAVFCALPHGTTQEVIRAIPKDIKVVDLSADFRLSELKMYAQVYGHEHKAPELQKEAVYGLTELARARVKAARLVANPGCYPTAAQLALAPLLESGAILPEDIIIDAKSGVSGAGRAAKEPNLFCEVAEGIHAYGIATHRHAPEIDQGLSRAAGKPVMAAFTPHLMPMSRGILATIYVRLKGRNRGADLRETLASRYHGEPFVRVLPEGAVPQTRHVRGSNYCFLNAFDDRLPGRAILVSAIDNLVKGASGQAVQNMNLMFGLPETAGLEQLPMFP